MTHYSEEHLRDPELLRLCALTRLIHDPTLPSGVPGHSSTSFNKIRVTVTTRDGKKYVSEKSSSDFSMHDYPTREQLLAKYWDQVNGGGLLKPENARKLIDLVDRLEELPDMREITDLLLAENNQ